MLNMIRNFRIKFRNISIIFNKIWKVIKVLLLFVILLSIFTSKVSPWKNYLNQEIYRFLTNFGVRLEQVDISGAMNLPKSDLEAILSPYYGVCLFEVDIDGIRAQLILNTWIKDVIVIYRNLPNKIKIIITERTPIALWQSNQKFFLIDQDGDVIETKNLGRYNHLPHFIGEGANIYAKEFLDVIINYPQIKENISNIIRSGQRRWDIKMKDNIVIKMPESNISSALDYLTKLYQENKIIGTNIKSIDLRISGKYYMEKK